MSLRNDPTQTTRIRKAWEGEILKRFRALWKKILQLVVTDDAFGLVGDPLVLHLAPSQVMSTLAEKGVWRFRTDPDKVKVFREWLQEQVDAGLLTTDAFGEAWTAKYVEAAYKKGKLRAFLDARGPKLDKPAGFMQGTKEEFLRTAFGQPEQLKKVALIATRAFSDLRGVTDTMATQLARVLANGILAGENPKQIARIMAKTIDGISKARALTIARTEIIYAHAEGQLDSFEELGVEEVGVYAEWSTVGDDKVCEQCAALEGAILTIEEARGLIPRHPNCRCAWIPATEVDNKNRRRALFRKIARSVGKGEKRGKSTWAGKLIKKKTRGGKPVPSGKGKRKR